jgi:hypothetical protein
MKLTLSALSALLLSGLFAGSSFAATGDEAPAVDNQALTYTQNDARELDVPQYTCDLRANVRGFGLSIGIGGQAIAGHGMITCTTTDGRYETSLPIRLRFLSAGVGWDFSIIQGMDVAASGIAVAQGPEALIGKYSVGVTTGATLIRRGIDFNAAIKAQRGDGLGFEVGLTGKRAVGLGVRLHGMVMIIERDN